MTTNYEKYFGTSEKVALIYSEINSSYEDMERTGQEAISLGDMMQSFFPWSSISKTGLDFLEWLQEECDE